jgi:hypothetical protein
MQVIICGVAIFSENDVQSAFHTIAPLLSANSTKQISNRLKSRRAKDALSAEWEIVMLNALRECGKVEIEPLLQSSTREFHPDVLLDPFPDDLFVLPHCYIEITSLSDAGFEADNPRQFFIEGFKRQVKRLSLPIHCFDVEIAGAIQDKTEADRRSKKPTVGSEQPPVNWGEWFRGRAFNDRKMRLSLPAKAAIESFVRGRLTTELQAVARESSRPHAITIADSGVQIGIDYNPRRSHFSYCWPSYTTAYSLTYNPVARRLNKKRPQISKCSAPRGVILCDAGCDILSDRGYVGPEGFRLREIVTNVLARRHEISFVLTFSVQQNVNGLGRQECVQLAVQAFCNPEKASFPIGETELDSLGRKVADHLPEPIDTPNNALHGIRSCQPLANAGFCC